MKGPAEPLIVRPGPAAVEGFAVPLRAALVVGVLEVVKELLREEVTLALPLSISFAILEARTLDWLSRWVRAEWDGVVEEGREGGLKGFFWVGVLEDEVRCRIDVLACMTLTDQKPGAT